MTIISLPVHPLSRRILLAELGLEPVAIPNHDFLFHLLNRRPQWRTAKSDHGLTATIDLVLDDRIALQVAAAPTDFGVALFKMHKQRLCDFVAAWSAATGKGGAKPAAQAFLDLFEVRDEEYSIDAAYKLWQRNGWELKRKNAVFFVRRSHKSADISTKKTAGRAKSLVPAPKPWVGTGIDIEVAAGRFAAALATLYRRVPAKLVAHARVYLYWRYSGATQKALCEQHGWKPSNVSYAVQRITLARRQRPTIDRLLSEAEQGLPKPEPVPTSSAQHATQLTFRTNSLSQRTARAHAG